MSNLLVAIDGGGTKTDAVLFTADGEILSRVTAPGCNPNDFGWQRAADVLEDALDALLRAYGGRKAELVSVFGGISGGTVGRNRAQMKKLLSDLLPGANCVSNDSDAVSALSSGIGRQDGCVLISGTGSVGFARSDGCILRVGGWGYLFDRGGSGYDFGRDAVTAALCAYDGRGPHTILSGMIEKHLGEPIQDAVTSLYRKGKPAIAALAPLVFQAAKKGDGAACGILDANAEELAKLCNALARMIPGDICKTVLAGSVFRDWDQISCRLEPLLMKRHEFIFPVMPPVFGSAVEAVALVREPDEAFEHAFASGLKRCPVQTVTERRTV